MHSIEMQGLNHFTRCRYNPQEYPYWRWDRIKHKIPNKSHWCPLVYMLRKIF